MLNILREYEKPIIVVLDGYVLGGGFGLAQACHIVVSSEKSRFAMPETAIGFSQMLVQLISFLALMILVFIWPLRVSRSAVVMRFTSI